MEPLAPLERGDLDALVDAVDRRALRVRHLERREAVDRGREAVEVPRIGRRHHHVRHRRGMPGCDTRERRRRCSANWALSVGDSGDGSLDLDDLDAHERVADAAPHAPRPCCATVSPSAMRRFSVADACDGSTFAAVPPDCMVARDGRAHERGRLAAERGEDPRGDQRRGGRGARSRCRAGPGVCAANCDSIREIAFGVRGRNVPRVEPVERAGDAPHRGERRGSGRVAALAAGRQAAR